MKRLFILIAVAATLAACGNSGNGSGNTDSNATKMSADTSARDSSGGTTTIGPDGTPRANGTTTGDGTTGAGVADSTKK
jgi:predicted small secreted protein